MPATGPKNITNAQLRAALRKHAGVYALAARELGCERSNVRMRVERSEELQQLCAEIEDEVGDACEAVIKSKLIAGDGEMARWYARHKLAGRGYTTRTELTGPNGGAIPVSASVAVTIEYVTASPEPDDEEIPA